MSPDTNETRSAVLASTVTAAAMIAFQVGAKATRDALFLSNFHFAYLPAMRIATSLLAIALAFPAARALTAWGPRRVVPLAFAGSASLLLIEWVVSLQFPRIVPVLVYLHYGCLGGLLISGFGSLFNERFDPRTAKQLLGRISGWATLGGLLGFSVAMWVTHTLPVTSMLPILAVFHSIAALVAMRIPRGADAVGHPPPKLVADSPERTARSGLHAIAGSPYLLGLVALVLLTATGEGLIDLVLQGRARAAFGEGQTLFRFFAAFYVVTSLLTLLVQMRVSRFALERLGPARTAALLPAGVTAAAASALLVPGLPTTALARGTESVLSISLYRPGYEVLFTPVPVREKRAVRALADVGASRIGDLIAAGIAQGVVLLFMSHAPLILTALALVVSTAAVLAAMRLHAGYVRSLEAGLLAHQIQIDPADVTDSITRMTLDRIADPRARDPKDSSGILRALRDGPVSPLLVHKGISLLGSDEIAREAIMTLRHVGPMAIEPLTARLVDAQEDDVIRRRIPLVLASYQDPRAVEGLARGLGDIRFEVRYRCGRGLSRLQGLDPSLCPAPGVAYQWILHEVKADANLWQGRILLDRLGDEAWSLVVDDVIRERANRSLEHVFTLLSLVLPREPVRIAFRGLHAEDAHLRGITLEYLEVALPPEIRKPLWPYLEDRRPRRPPSEQTLDEALARLLKSNESILVHLEDLKRKGAARGGTPEAPVG